MATSSSGARTGSLKTTAAPRDVHRFHDAPLPSVPTRDNRRSRVGVSVDICESLIGRLDDVMFPLVPRTKH